MEIKLIPKNILFPYATQKTSNFINQFMGMENKMKKLTFRTSKKLRSLAKATLEASEFKIGYPEKTTKTKSMFLVKDDGIYLMNSFTVKNGKTPLENDYVVYAWGYNPNTNEDIWEDSYEVSRDDFGESLELGEEWLVKIANGHSLYIWIDSDSYRMGLGG